jgi:23S rRNA (cytidine1920-2'-O)/16S rRNA (cytidine1409-2'-O)-methyltransferase
LKKRADQQLVEQGLVETRSRARDLIKRGLVKSNGFVVKKPSEQIAGDQLEISEESSYVSRGYLKLKGICEQIEISFVDKIVGDFGASTGGFTEYALECGARKVYCVDVGTDQLHQKLKDDSRVIDLANTNIKNGVELETKVDIAVIDLSFISLKLVLENIVKNLKIEGAILALIKPQFEVGKGNLDKKGIVKNPELSATILKEMLQTFKQLGLSVKYAAKCDVMGKIGNQEYFFYGIHHDQASIDERELEKL